MTAEQATDARPERGFVPADGLEMYYESSGSGQPLVLLHGGVGASEMFGGLAPALATSRRVVALHLQGHGHTRDVDRPLRYETMGDDVAAAIEVLGIAPADVMGYSLGAGAAYQLAIRHPELVRRLVLVSQPIRHSGWYPEVQENMARMGPEMARFMGQSPLSGLYPEADWPTLFGKLGEVTSSDYDWSAQVAKLTAPILFAFADADAVRPEHILEIFGLFGGGRRDAGLDGSLRPRNRLAIVPGATHYDVVLHPAMAQLVAEFLDAPLEG